MDEERLKDLTYAIQQCRKRMSNAARMYASEKRTLERLERERQSLQSHQLSLFLLTDEPSSPIYSTHGSTTTDNSDGFQDP